MSDDGTRTGFGFGLGGEGGTKSVIDKKIQVRLTTGKIYGPYQRSEVIAFIFSKKLGGEEQILIDGESQWKAIASDIDFYDAFQEVLFGKGPTEPDKPTKSKSRKGSTEISRRPSTGSVPPPSREAVAPPAFPDKPEKARERVGTVPTSNQVIELGRGQNRAAEIPPDPASVLPGQIPPPLPPPTDPAKRPSPQSAGPGKKRLAAGLAVALIALAGLYLKRPGGPPEPTSSATSFGALQAQSWYARPLALAMAQADIAVGALPAKLEPSERFTFPEGFNAHVWIQDLKRVAEADPQEKLTAMWWARWSWDAYWLGMTIVTLDAKLGGDLMNRAITIVTELEKRKLLREPAASLFKGAQQVAGDRWGEAAGTFELIAGQSPIGAWLAEESRWQAFWASGAKGIPPKRLVEEYESGSLEMSSQVRAAFVDRDVDRFNDWVSQLATEEPVSTTLWFTTAQVNWRFNKEGAQVANKLFITGLGSLAMQPRPVQLVYWSQFAEFLAIFGRQATTNKAVSNRDALAAGNLERDPAALQKWWDLNQTEFDMPNLAAEVFKRSEKAALNARDLATLFVLGYVVPQGGKYLAVAGGHYALERQWGRAAQVFEQVTRVDRGIADGWGGLIWVNASLYRFDKAFKAMDELSKLELPKPESTKYEALLYSLGREYERAGELFEQYLKTSPNDPWGHYFSALNSLAQEQNVKCVSSANLALAHAGGELLLRTRLLLLRCRVLANIQIKDAMGELEKMSQEDPANTAILVELIDAQIHSDLIPAAVTLTENSIRRFKRSYELRMKRGEIYELVKEYDLAVAFYQRALRDRDDTVEPLIKIGRVYELQKKYLDAAQTFEAASRKEPDYPEVYLLAARAYEKSAKVREAAMMYEKEIEARPAYVAAFLEASEFYLKFNDPGAVPRIFQKFNSEFQDHPRIRTRLAQAYFAMKQPEKALEEAQRAITLDAKQGEAQRIMGLIYDEQGQYELAKRYLENYLALVPGAADSDTIRAKLGASPYR